MAAPPEITIKNLSGNWMMNKTLSDDTDALLTLQGIGWWTRKAIALATITLHINQFTEDGISRLVINSTATGGIKGTTEYRTLNWENHEHSDPIFGTMQAKSRWSTIELVNDEFCKEGWLEDDEEAGGPNGEKHIEGFVDNKERGWTAKQFWGFARFPDGVRYHTRKVVVTKGKQIIKVRLVYNYAGKYTEGPEE